MTARHELPKGYTLRITTSSGDITVIAEERADVATPDGASVMAMSAEERQERRKGRGRGRDALHTLAHLAGVAGRKRSRPGPVLSVRGKNHSSDIEVRCPKGTPVSVGSMSGDVELRGEFGDVSVTTASGDVTVEGATALDARSISGHLEVGACFGPCRLNTKSGRIHAEETGPTEAMTVSGTVTLGKTSGNVKVHTVSGGIRLATDGREGVTVRTISGSVSVSVPRGRDPDARLKTLSGKVKCDCPPGGAFPLEVKTVSGSIEVTPT